MSKELFVSRALLASRDTPAQRLRATRQKLRRAAQRARRDRRQTPPPIVPPPLALQRRRSWFRSTGREALPAPPAAGIVVHNRLAFGPRPGDIASFNALAGSDPARLQIWLDEQLHPATINDSAAAERMSLSGFQTLGKSLTELWQEHALSPDSNTRMQPFWETQLATFVRAIHSRRQLFEVMVEFWHNHFSIFGDDGLIGPTWVHNDRDVIRAHALGNFRRLLEAVTTSPAMLFYLDNAFNSSEDANENFARELLELHTLGSDVYLGSLPPDQVPEDDNGWPLGYVESDVVAAARCLTGWTVNSGEVDGQFGEDGTFLYWDPWHDQESKSLLGLSIPASRGSKQDGWDLLDRLAQHPATGRHIATKIARRLLSDSPPRSVVDAAAAVFTAQHAASDQIAQVVREIVLSPEFLATWAEKVKRPFEIAISAFRAVGGDLPFRLDDSYTSWFRWEFNQAGQPLFSWEPPNGFPDVKAVWNTSSPRIMCWRLANFFVEVHDPVSSRRFFDVIGQTPAGARSARALVDFWSDRIFQRPLPAAEEQELVAFMAQGTDPLSDLHWDSDWEVRERLIALVALMLQSPSFLWR